MTTPVLERELTREEIEEQEAAYHAEMRARVWYDVVDGVCVERDLGWLSSWVGSEVGFWLRTYTHEHGGDVLGADGSFRIFPAPHSLKVPDVSYLAPGRLDQRKDGPLTTPPDLVVEIVSPSDLAEATELKRDAWLRAGVRRVWLVFPNARSVHVFGSDGSSRLLQAADTLIDEELLPGFAVPVAKLFPAPAEPVAV